MEPWFWAAIGAAILAGVSNFYFKTAAAKGFHAETFSFYGSIVTLILIGSAYLVFPAPLFTNPVVAIAVFLGGFLAAISVIMKVYALRYIDTTIDFPLFKLLAPAVAIVLGVTVFAEQFSTAEWIGLILGLSVPLLLINKIESQRQNNLVLGLLFVLVTGIISAFSAAINKFGIDAGLAIVVTFAYMALGLLAGNLFTIAWKDGVFNVIDRIRSASSLGLVKAGTLRSVLITVSVGLTLYGYWLGGPLAIMQTIHSMYILIPIVLAIIFYNEHWNLQKAAAILLSVASLVLLG